MLLRPAWHTSPSTAVFDSLMANDNLRERVPDTVPDDVELFESGGDVHGRDDHGEFALAPMAGDEQPQDERCGAVLKYTMDRYGETRYCGGLPVGTFGDHNYEHDDYCKHHQTRQDLMERAQELYEHGYFATNYINFAKRLSPPKFLFAVEMAGGLFEQSEYDFDLATEERTIDTSDSKLIEEDAVEVELPIPTSEMFATQANELWTAALKEVMTQNMQEAVFEAGMSKRTLAASADMEGQITDTKHEMTEHHLHLPISRLAKDIKEHLQNGGVVLDADESGTVTFQKNDYTLAVETEENDSADAQDHSKVSAEFAEQLEADGEEIEVEQT
jgi:hypothetical protein